MLLKIIKTELTSLLSWYRGAMYLSLDPSQIIKFRGKFTTQLDFQCNVAAKKNVIEITSQLYREISREPYIISLLVVRFFSSSVTSLLTVGILVCQLGGVNSTYERYILGPTLVNWNMSRISKNDVSYFDFSSLCVFYRPESLRTRTFTKYIDQTYMVKNFKNKSVIAQTWQKCY